MDESMTPTPIRRRASWPAGALTVPTISALAAWPARAQDGLADGATATGWMIAAAVAAAAFLVLLALHLGQRRRAAAERAGFAERLEILESESGERTVQTGRQEAELALLRDKIAALGRERDGYRALLNAAPVAAWRRDSHGAIVWRNRMLEGILGPDATDDEIASASDLDQPIRLVQEARDRGETAEEERRFVVEGQRRIFRVFETPELPDGGSAGYAVDMSLLDEVRREMRRQIEANTEMLEHITTGVAIYDADKRLIHANSAFRSLWGLDESFLASGPSIGEVLDRVKELRKLPEQTEYRQFRKSREALFNSLINPVEELYQRPDERMMRVTIVRHGLGGLMFLFDDATDRIVLERNLNTYIAVQRATLDNLYEAVAVFGPDGRLSLCNAGYRIMWNLPREFTDSEPHARELVDHMLEGFGHPPELAARRDAWIASATEIRSGERRIELPNGQIIDAASTALPDARTLFTYLDVTDSYRIERALRERNEALVAADMIKSEFLENMSYELRTPLNTILGFAEILQNDYFGTLNDRQREYASGILEASEQFLSMINDMLDLASIQAGHLQVDRDVFVVSDIIEQVQEKYGERAERRQLALSSELPDDLPRLDGDPRRIQQILNNLMSNAVKFTPPGGAITIGAARTEDGADIWVEDTGIGIPEEERERVFETFRTSERHTRRGAGLGLALVRNLMELHGGSVELTSEVGVGTRVVCHFRDQMPEDTETIRISGAPVEPLRS
ncbi:MAG: hypothetical protein TEF_00790 [Rhizobiales bacterium NRL2]|nr:MAG: hypothetical protein TEF_00790 [Rhizobiales bacterium NRL2]